MSTTVRSLRCSSFTLRDGRTLAFREYGLGGEGFPVVFLHGNLNSRFFAPSWTKTEEHTMAAGCRVIAVDRPGYGDSCFQPNRQYAEIAKDVTELLDHLELPRAAILGYSSGGPNAMACATFINPARISALGLVSTDGPYAEMGSTVTTQLFKLTEEEEEQLIVGGSITPEMSLWRAESNYNDLHAAFDGLTKPDRRELALRDLEHAVKQGLDKGPSQDTILESSPWGFTLEDLRTALSASNHNARVTPCLLWHGANDSDVPPFVAEYIRDRVPLAHVDIVDGESHSMIRRKWNVFLSSLVAAVDAAEK